MEPLKFSTPQADTSMEIPKKATDSNLALLSASNIDSIAIKILPNSLPNFEDLFGDLEEANNEKIAADKVYTESLSKQTELEQEIKDETLQAVEASQEEALAAVAEEVAAESAAIAEAIIELSMSELIATKDAIRAFVVFSYVEGFVRTIAADQISAENLQSKFSSGEIGRLVDNKLKVPTNSPLEHGSKVTVIVDGEERELVVEHFTHEEMHAFNTFINDFIQTQLTSVAEVKSQSDHKEVGHHVRVTLGDKSRDVVILVRDSGEPKVDRRALKSQEKVSEDKTQAAEKSKDQAAVKEERERKKDEILIEKLILILAKDIERYLIANAELKLQNLKQEHSLAMIERDQINQFRKQVTT